MNRGSSHSALADQHDRHVGSSVGLHARPAAIISEAAGDLDSAVTLAVAGAEPVDAASSLLIMTLGASCGDSVEVGGDDQAP